MTAAWWSWLHCSQHGGPEWLCPPDCNADLTEHDARVEGNCVSERERHATWNDPGEPAYSAVEDAVVALGPCHVDVDVLPGAECERIEDLLWERDDEDRAELRQARAARLREEGW